jgi:hypothetical protein
MATHQSEIKLPVFFFVSMDRVPRKFSYRSPDEQGIDFTAGPCQSSPLSLLRVCMSAPLGSKVVSHCVWPPLFH